jgi:hypothetical protein
LFGRDQALSRRRGAYHVAVRSSSSRRLVLSIQPTHSASSTASS